MFTVVSAIALPPESLALLDGIAVVAGPDDWRDSLHLANALVMPVSERVDSTLLQRAPRLRIVANAGVGYDNVDLAACQQRGIVVTNTPGVLTAATADLAMALMLATVRGLPRAEASLRAGEFRGWGFWDYVHGDVTNATIGILGMGRIGQAFARRAVAFDARIQYHNRTRLPEELELEIGARWVDWAELLETSDILSLHAAFSPALRHVLDAAALRQMKHGSFIVNTARGALIDEGALVEALRNGPLAGAGLDVYEREPAIHPGLLDLPNVVLLPHIGSATPATRTAMALLACRNVAAVLTGQPPLTAVSS
jgi:lactate dehydrogenase-like 2-hydroxyacid dehydrogenase